MKKNSAISHTVKFTTEVDLTSKSLQSLVSTGEIVCPVQLKIICSNGNAVDFTAEVRLQLSEDTHDSYNIPHKEITGSICLTLAEIFSQLLINNKEKGDGTKC